MHLFLFLGFMYVQKNNFKFKDECKNVPLEHVHHNWLVIRTQTHVQVVYFQRFITFIINLTILISETFNTYAREFQNLLYTVEWGVKDTLWK